MLYANSEGPGECAHPYSLIWTFSVHRHILQYLLILLADNEGPDQPALMPALSVNCIRVLSVCCASYKNLVARKGLFGLVVELIFQCACPAP